MHSKILVLLTMLGIAPLLALSASVEASEMRPTVREFKEWSGQGASYGFECKVTATGAKLTIRATPGGRSIGQVRRGQSFILDDVRATRDGRLWYRNSVAYKAPKGWFPSEAMECDPEHYD